MADQSFENHAKMVPGYHYLGSPILLAALALLATAAVRTPSSLTIGAALLAVGVMFSHAFARLFPLGVQDRLIRLEEQLRLARVLPEELRGRIDEFTANQLIGLRFASDEELPELARRVLDGEFASGKEIKAAIRSWRPDHQRI